jgi:hypothetical protein
VSECYHASRDFQGGFGREARMSEDKAGSAATAGKSKEFELRLGLSPLGDCYNTDPMRNVNKQCMAPSSSIAAVCTLPGIGGDDLAVTESQPPLMVDDVTLKRKIDLASLKEVH